MRSTIFFGPSVFVWTRAPHVILIAPFACVGWPALALDLEEVRIPSKPGRVQKFSDESEGGELTAKLFKPAGVPAPFFVFVHGCGGLKLDAVGHWAEFLTKRGVGVLMMDSLVPRGRQNVCGDANLPSGSGAGPTMQRCTDVAAVASICVPDRVADGLIARRHGGPARDTKQAINSQEIVGAIATYPFCA